MVCGWLSSDEPGESKWTTQCIYRFGGSSYHTALKHARLVELKIWQVTTLYSISSKVRKQYSIVNHQFVHQKHPTLHHLSSKLVDKGPNHQCSLRSKALQLEHCPDSHIRFLFEDQEDQRIRKMLWLIVMPSDFSQRIYKILRSQDFIVSVNIVWVAFIAFIVRQRAKETQQINIALHCLHLHEEDHLG